MSKAVNIRTARSADLPLIVEFNRAMALETEGKKLSKEVLNRGVSAVINDNSKGFYIVAEFAGEVCGSLMITREWSDWRNGDFWWIQSVYIIPESRRKGIYSLMYDFVKDLARQQDDVVGVRLYVEKENAVARKTYQELGMEQCSYDLYEAGLEKTTEIQE